MTAFPPALPMIPACAFAYARSRRRPGQAVPDRTAADDDQAVARHAQAAAPRSRGIPLPPEREKELLRHSDPEQSLFCAPLSLPGQAAQRQVRPGLVPRRRRVHPGGRRLPAHF